MIRHSKAFVAFILISIRIFGQPYGNEWIDYSQTYFKFSISKDGVYRISQSTLQNAGFPVASVDPRNIQLFLRGQEHPIYVEGESDGQFNVSDFIEFYAEANDGFADEEMYAPGEHAHPAYSLVSDTIYAFLTWNNSMVNKRLNLESDVSYSTYNPSNYIWHRSRVDPNIAYYTGQTFTGGGTDPEYDKTEGWFDSPILLGGSRVANVQTTNEYSSGPSAIVKWKIIGASDFAPLSFDHHLRVTGGGITFDTIYEGYEVLNKQFTTPMGNLSGNFTSFTFNSINDLGSNADRSAIAYVEIDYPHQLGFGNSPLFHFHLPDQPGQSKAYLPFSGIVTGSPLWVYDLTNDRRIVVTTTGSSHEVLIPNAGNDKNCIVFSTSSVQQIGNLKRVNGSGNFRDFSQDEISEAFLILTHSKLMSEANLYASYRSISGSNSVVVNMNDLYDQFIFGIPKHPLAIRHFIEYIFDRWSEKPAYLFLLGKSIKTHLHRKNGTLYTENLVPSYGNPASDILLTAGLNTTFLDPLVPTGRLAAKNPSDVSLYLNKVMEFEGNSPQRWMKNVLHFAGGQSITESARFVSYLQSFENILTDTSFGARVYTFRKSTTSPIQISLADSIQGLINNGASVLTFFGHASTTGGFDQNIDEPQNLNNKGKYPLLVGNSCFTGDIHESSGLSTSEKFVLIKDKGMIAFLASVDLGLENKLRDYSNAFFESFGQVNYGEGIGDHMKHAIQKIQVSGNNFGNRSVGLLMTLHGDPSLVVNAQEKPDYEITPSQISTDPQILSTQTDSFELHIKIFNNGKAIGDSVGVEVIRVFPDFSIETSTISSAPVLYEHTVVLKLPLDQIRGAGLNRFDISVDPSNLIPEISESNNFVSVNYFIRSGDIIPVIPYEFAIVPDQSPELQASTGYAFEVLQQYEFQLDTNNSFQNPIETADIAAEGGVVVWKPQQLGNMKDSTVFFWRARNKDVGSNSIWRHSSFQFIPKKRGWSQNHFDQFDRNDLEFVDLNFNTRKFEFAPNVKKLSCQTISTLNFSDLGDILYRIDAELGEYGGCGLAPAIHIAVLDSLSFKPWGTPFQGQNPNNYFGQINFDGNCGKNRVQNFFIFQSNNATQLAGLKNMLENRIPDGNYILAWTWVRNNFSNWDAIDPGMRQVFTNLGADSIQYISNDSLPYIFFVKKGDPSSAIEEIGMNYNEFIFLSTDLMNNTTYGTMNTRTIGPASRWDSLHWHFHGLDNPADRLTLDISGHNKSFTTKNSLLTLQMNDKRVSLQGVIEASQHPLMTDEVYLEDNANQTSPQPDQITVLYEGVMELALNASSHFEFHSDSLQEGDVLQLSMAIRNISEYDADSVLIGFSILDRNRNIVKIPSRRIEPIPAGEETIFNFEYPTFGLRGQNTLMIDVNPNHDQLEQTHFNNVGQVPFFVITDRTNPLLDVTFDGIHILDGDIVSAKPNIVIQLTDENPFLILDDTSDFRIFMTTVNGTEVPLYFENSNQDYQMEFIPASGSKNKARVELQPTFRHDGYYALRVNATDRSENESGDVDYMISFEVVTRSTITNLLNYPNPFSTSTKFVFVLTGSRIPDDMQIQIITISGKIVKTIDMYELGPIRIGRNVTDYSWDGRDEYGDKLANGVYLYRVQTRLEGQEIEHRHSKADGYFKKGFGKLVILR